MAPLHPDRLDPATAHADSRADDRYRPLFVLSSQPAWVFDRETLRFLDVNEAAVRSYGWTREEFLGMTLRDIRPPEAQAALDGNLADGVGVLRVGPSVHVAKSGQRRSIEIVSYPVEFDGRAARMVLVHDVTDRYEAQQALVRSEQKYRSVIEQMQDVFFRTDENGLWTFLNPAWTALTGHGVLDSLGTHYLTHVHPSDRTMLLDAVRPLAVGAMESSLVQVRFFRRDGGYRWVEASTRATRDAAGSFEGTTGTLRDVTERRAAEQERQRLATNVRQLLEASGEGIFGLDARGVITFVNRRGSEMLGYEAEELIGRNMHQLTHYARADGSPYPVEECPIQRAAIDGIATEVDDEVMWRKDRTSLQVEYSASPVRENDHISGAVVNFRDITARRRDELELVVARDAAEAASRAKSDFLARMSHELRTPLNSIIGFANVLLKNKAGSLRTDDLSYLARIAANGRHLLGLINDILDLSKIEAGRMTIELSSVALDQLILETVAELEGQTRDRAVVLRAEIPLRLLPIETDAGRLKQVLINLIGNALKFTEQGEIVVSVEASDVGTPILLQVRDTGIGIPRDRLDAIFNVFEQAEAMINRRFGGTGLGLTISRSLCELMGHRLLASSVEGVGTTMGIRLGEGRPRGRVHTPVAMPVVRRSGDPSQVAPYSAQQIVLVVDDDPDARALLAEILDEVGCRTVGASTGVEALRLARELRPAAIFLDLRLPKISGYDVLRILKADDSLRDTPVIVVSAVASESRNALAGAAAILDKPVSREQLLRVVRELVPAIGG